MGWADLWSQWALTFFRLPLIAVPDLRKTVTLARGRRSKKSSDAGEENEIDSEKRIMRGNSGKGFKKKEMRD